MASRDILFMSSLLISLFLVINAGESSEEHHHHGHDHMHHMHSESSSNIFLQTKNFIHPNDFQVGKVLPIYFGGTFNSRPHFLSKEKADRIPFSSEEIPAILKYFGFPEGSPQAKAIEFSLKHCEEQTMEGDYKICATSLESMKVFLRKVFGPIGTSFKVLSTSPLQKGTKTVQNYTIVSQPKSVPSPRAVVCHVVAYPYAVFYCHYQETDNRVIEVPLKGEDGTTMDAIAICHMDSLHMDPQHIAFTNLGFKQGSPVCHFVPPEELIWVPAGGSEEDMVKSN